jgi:adenylate kinase
VDIVLLGAPGAGKGTQAEMLVRWLAWPHVSTGDLFREAIGSRTRLGLEAKAYIDRGELVPDGVTCGMVAERLERPDCAQGVIFDGFPRTVVQAEALDGILAKLQRRVDIVPYVRVSQETLLKRLAGRWTCSNCGAVYHALYSPEKIKGVCDACQGALAQRADDTPETQKRRIAVYMAQTAPLIEFYHARNLLVELDGEQDIESVQRDLRRAIEALRVHRTGGAELR